MKLHDLTKRALRSEDIRRIYEVLWQRQARFFVILGLTALFTGLLVLVPLWMDRLVNDALLSQELGTIVRHLLLGLLLFLGLMAAEYGRDYTSSRLANEVSAELRERMFRKLVLAPLTNLRTYRTGDLVSRLSSDIQVFSEGMLHGALDLVPNILVVCALVGMMLFQSAWLFLLTLALISPLALVSNLLLRKIKEHSGRAQVRQAELSSALDETVRGIKEIKSGNQEARINAWYDGLNRSALAAKLRLELVRLLNPAVVASQTYVTIGILVLICSWLLFEGLLKADELTVFATSLLLVLTPAQRLSRALGQLSQVAGVMGRIDAILDAPEEPVSDPALPALPRLAGDIRLEGVGYSYGPDFTLRDIDLHVRAGETVALIGPSGGGKTTLIGLLFRFMEPDCGTILLDGLDSRGYRIDSLRRQIALVPQEPTIFDGTLLENIRFARPEAGADEIRRAAEAAQVAGFAQSLEQGYDTPLGQFGSRLSAGQRQRIAIARAFLQDPRILVLDEPTSALDGETESLINATLATLWADRTVIIVAHRPSTMRIADRILVMETGRLRPATKAEEVLIRTPEAAASTSPME